jgi:hypothetical protein
MKFAVVCAALIGIEALLLNPIAGAQTAAGSAASAKPTPLIDVTASEGTSMAVAVSPDGKTLAIDRHTLEKTITKPLRAPRGYAALLKDIKERVRTAQVRAALAVNRELILLYWSIGRDILDWQ